MTAPERPGYSSFAAIPRDLRTRLSRAEESTRTLAEMLAIDFAIYLPIIDSRVSEADARACQDAGGITRKIAMAAEVIARIGDPRAADKLAKHPTDLARGIAAYVVGVHASRAIAQLDTNDAKGAVGGGAKADNARRTIVTDAINAVRPLADDEHSGVREWAWMGIRPLLARDIEHSIAALEPWTRDASPNIRRFATEATRPRGVWCAHIAALRADPSLGLPLLEPLKADPTKYVQDSVANWLNDASKDDEKFVRTLTTRWTKDAAKLSKSNPAAAKATTRIITRALRTVGVGA